MPVLQNALVRSFAEIYGSEPQHLSEADFDAAEVARYEAEFKSDAFRLGTRLPFTWQAEARFEWGSLTLACRVDGGKVQEALAGAGQFFKGCAFSPEALAQAAQKIAGQAGNDISKFLAQITI